MVLFNQCPDSWVQAYTLNNMLACDPIIQLARRQTLPIYWNRLDEKARFLQEGSMDVMGWRRNSGCATDPRSRCTGRRGERHYLVHHLGAGVERSDAGVPPILSWMSNYIFEAAIRIVRQSMRGGRSPGALTERETECLFWASEGRHRGDRLHPRHHGSAP